ncbi:MAG: fibronectin type III domain-containing protein, partial [Bacteroidetes bacterium]|nr:fibronectin type III domain-containing protein [Bacteroidota bacterium]
MKKLYSVLLCSGIFFSQAFAQGDNCATAVPVTAGTYVANGPSVGGGANNSCAGYGGANADWYSFVPSCDGSINVNSCFGGADTKLQVYSGDCGTLSCVGSSDDFCNTGFGSFYASQVTATVTAGVTYYIQWDNYWTGAGFTWSLSYTPSSSATGIATSAITSTGATSTWTDGTATDWTIEYGLAGFVLGSGTSANVLTQSYNFTGLQPETSYEYYVQAGTGCFVGPYSFTTLPVCPVPTSPNVTGLSASGATLNWTAGGMETLWDVEWGTSGFLLGAGTQDYGLLTNSDGLTGLTGSTDYHWYVRAVCDLNVGDGVDTMSYFVG